jgi:hypothetical protein
MKRAFDNTGEKNLPKLLFSLNLEFIQVQPHRSQSLGLGSKARTYVGSKLAPRGTIRT